MAGWKDKLRGILRYDERRRDAAANEAQVAFLLPCRHVVPLATLFLFIFPCLVAGLLLLRCYEMIVYIWFRSWCYSCRRFFYPFFCNFVLPVHPIKVYFRPLFCRFRGAPILHHS
jgi:hypothetical protein